MEQAEKVCDKMIRTWIADIRSLYDADCYAEYYESAPEFRKEKADHIKDVKKKAQSIGAWALYEKARRLGGISREAVYNLSHAGDYVLCSVDDTANSDIQVGCDLEEIKIFHEKLVRRYFCEEEQKYILEKGTEEEKKAAFYRYWVLKESFMKATRRGMGLGLNTFTIRCTDGKAPQLVKMPEDLVGTYYFKEYSLNIPYKIAVCATENVFDEEIQKVEL